MIGHEDLRLSDDVPQNSSNLDFRELILQQLANPKNQGDLAVACCNLARYHSNVRCVF